MEVEDPQGSVQGSSIDPEEEIKETLVQIKDLIDQSKDSASRATAVLEILKERLNYLQSVKKLVTKGPNTQVEAQGTDPIKPSSTSNAKIRVTPEYLSILNQAIQLAEIAVKEIHSITMSHQKMEAAIDNTRAGKLISQLFRQRLAKEVEKFGIDDASPTQYSQNSKRNLLVKEDFERFKDFVTQVLFRCRPHYSYDPALCRRCYKIYYINRYKEEFNPTCLTKPKSKKKDPVHRLLIPLRYIFKVYDNICETTQEEFIDLINDEFLNKDESIAKESCILRNFNFENGINVVGRKFVIGDRCQDVLKWPLFVFPVQRGEVSKYLHECLKDDEFKATKRSFIDIDFVPGRPVKAGTILTPLGGNKDAEELDDITIRNRFRDLSLDVGTAQHIDSIMSTPLSINSRQSAQQAQRIKQYKQTHEDSFLVKKEAGVSDENMIEDPGSSLKEEPAKKKRLSKKDIATDNQASKEPVQPSDEPADSEQELAKKKTARRGRENLLRESPEKGDFQWVECEWMSEKSSKIKIKYEEELQSGKTKKMNFSVETEMIDSISFYVPRKYRHQFNPTEEDSEAKKESDKHLEDFIDREGEEEQAGSNEEEYLPSLYNQKNLDKDQPAPEKSKSASPLPLQASEPSAKTEQEDDKPKPSPASKKSKKKKCKKPRTKSKASKIDEEPLPDEPNSAKPPNRRRPKLNEKPNPDH